MSNYYALSILGICGLAPPIYRLTRWRLEKREVLAPDLWRPTYTRSHLIRLTKKLLKSQGWTILPAWEWVNVWVRAEKNGIYLNLVVYEVGTLSLGTISSDVREETTEDQSIVGILTMEQVEQSRPEDSERERIFYVKPEDLCTVDKKVGKIYAWIHEQRRLRDASVIAARIAEDAHFGHLASPRTTSPPQSSSPISNVSRNCIIGFIESHSATHIWGWAYSSDQPDEHLSIELIVNGAVIASVMANVHRSDLEKAEVGKGDHAFCITFEANAAEKESILVEAVAPTGERSKLNWLV